MREDRRGIWGIFLGELRVFWEENLKNSSSLGEGEIFIDLLEIFKGKKCKGITVGTCRIWFMLSDVMVKRISPLGEIIVLLLGIF